MRAIGRSDIPYRINALAAFTSYSIGHNVGASVFTGGAVRYRIYSAWGLNAIDVAKICFLAGLTFWLGNAAVLGTRHRLSSGSGLLDRPVAALAQPPRCDSRIIVGLVGYVVWVWMQPRNVGRGPWTVVLPGGPLTLLQIAIGIVDLGFCALAMYVLVPDEPNLGFVVVAVIFVSATLLGFASHSPGGLGVFDAAMLVGLWQMDREDLLAGMLLFRAALLYCAVRHICNLADVSGGYPRRPSRNACGRRRPGSTPSRRAKPSMCGSEGPRRLTRRLKIAERVERVRPDGNRRYSFLLSFRRGRTGCGIRPSSCWPPALALAVLVVLRRIVAGARGRDFRLHRRRGAGAVAAA